jgi:HEAT repeat protein
MIQALYSLNAALLACGLLLAVCFAFSEAAFARRARRREEALARVSSELSGMLQNTAFPDIVRHFSLRRQKLDMECLEAVILDMLERRGQPKKKRWQASLAYRLRLPSSIPALLSSGREESILLGARKAGLYRTEKALPFLSRLLARRSGAVQLSCLIAISRIGGKAPFLSALRRLEGAALFSPKALDEVFLEYAGDKEEAIHEILGWEASEFVIPALKAVTKETSFGLSGAIGPLCESQDKEVRIAALNALGRMPHDAPADVFRAALDDPEWQVRSAACRLLGSHIALSCGSLLLHAISDLSWWVRQNAAASVIPYIEFNEHLLTQFNFRDPYALNALRFALEKARKPELLSMLASMSEEASRAKLNNIYYITYKTDRDQSLTATLIDI